MTQFEKRALDGANPQDRPAGTDSFVQNKWALLKAVEGARVPLGLKGTTIALLRAMLSFVRSDQINQASDAHHICFASNAALAERTHVSVQTVERHVAKLVAVGLITRRPSGNGKRWARRNGQGGIVLATGLSLMPLVARYAELTNLAEAEAVQVETRQLLRDRCKAALASLRDTSKNLSMVEYLGEQARRLFRRKCDTERLEAFLAEVEMHLPERQPSEPVEMRDTDTQNEGQKDTNLTQSVNRKPKFEISVSPEDMQRTFPRLCGELRFLPTQLACDKRMEELATELRLGALWSKLNELGCTLRFMVLGYVLERIESIERPAGYAQSLVQGLLNGKISWERLLKRPVRTLHAQALSLTQAVEFP